MKRELPDRKRIAGYWESQGVYPDVVAVAMSDGTVMRYRQEAGEHPGFLRAMEILHGWRAGKHERRDT